MNIHNRRFSFFLVLFILGLSFSTSYAKTHYLKVPSLALKDSNRVIITTPDDFEQYKRGGYPFIIMLHGWSGDETQWEDDSDLQSLANTHRVLLVLPDGGYDGWWIDSNNDPGRDYATHLHQELKIWVVENFNGSKDPCKHGIMGLSMGGFGAISQALLNPDSYCAAASLSGVMDITRHTASWGLENALGQYTDHAEAWKQVNPLHLSHTVSPPSVPPLLLICGRDDFAFVENQDIIKIFKELDFKVTLNEESGAHTHEFWKTHVETAIAFLVSHFDTRD